MPVSSSAAKVPRLGQIDCWIGLAGVAQSVAQLSCKQQVTSSSLVASSLTRTFVTGRGVKAHCPSTRFRSWCAQVRGSPRRLAMKWIAAARDPPACRVQVTRGSPQDR